MFPSKRRKRYREHLEPGAQFSVPDSTKRPRNRPPQPGCDGISSVNQDQGGTHNSDALTPGHESEILQHVDSIAASLSNDDAPAASSNDGPTSVSSNDDPTSASSNDAYEEVITDNLPSTSGTIPNRVNSESEPAQQIEQAGGDGELQEQLNLFTVNETQGDTRGGAEQSKPKINYIEKYHLNDPIGPVNITKTKFETLVMIFHIVMRHGMTGKFIEDMETFVNELLKQEHIPVSKYLFNKIFETNFPMQFHFFCQQCDLYLGERESFKKNNEKTQLCPNCDKKCNVQNLDGTDFFITIPIKPQLEALVKKPGLVFLINDTDNSSNYCDITNGQLFKKLYGKSDVTLTINSDGAEAFHTGQYSLWPLQALVNNLPPTERFRGENMIVCGLWFGKKSPIFPIFLKAFNEEIIKLAEEGIRVETSDGEPDKRRVFTCMCSVDSVAKLQNHKQFNGHFSCMYCLHPGDKIQSKSNLNNVCFTAQKQYPLRTNDSIRADMFRADELDMAGQLRKSKNTVDHVNGLKGLSPLISLPKFDICGGFVIDYMHNVLLGVTSKLVELWHDPKNDCIVSGKKLSVVDERLVSLTPPKDVLISPRPLSKYSDFKAKEFRPLLLYYLLPCARDVLKDRHFNNLRDFASAIHILLKDSISPGEIDEADRLLNRFVKEYNRLYGDINMTYNVHLSTHLVMMVKMWGPLWAYSNFSFESGNGNLLKLNAGTRGVANQLALKYCTARTIADSMSKNEISSDVLNFCSDVVSTNYSKSKDYGSVRGFGEVFNVANEKEVEVLARASIEVSHLVYFNRAIRNGIWYYSRAYLKPKVFDDSCICLNDGRYARIWKIVKLPDTVGLNVIIKPIRVAAVPHLAPHVKTCSRDLFESYELLHFNDIKTKSVLLTVDEKSYVCNLANFYEVH